MTHERRRVNLAAIGALMDRSGAPYWICAELSGWEGVDEARGCALLTWLQSRHPIPQDGPDARSLELAQRWLRRHSADGMTPPERHEFDRDEGSHAARRMILRGEDLHYLTVGEISGMVRTCPRCLVESIYEEDGSPKCARCGSGTVREASLGCLQADGTASFLSGFNETVAEHLRSTVNPAFRWSDVRRLR